MLELFNEFQTIAVKTQIVSHALAYSYIYGTFASFRTKERNLNN